VVTFRVTVAGTLGAFDRQAFKGKLASLLPSISADHISLSLSAGSVVVDAIITTPSSTSPQLTAQILNSYDATALSASLGVVVESVELATVATVPIVSSLPPSPSRTSSKLPPPLPTRGLPPSPRPSPQSQNSDDVEAATTPASSNVSRDVGLTVSLIVVVLAIAALCRLRCCRRILHKKKETPIIPVHLTEGACASARLKTTDGTDQPAVRRPDATSAASSLDPITRSLHSASMMGGKLPLPPLLRTSASSQPIPDGHNRWLPHDDANDELPIDLPIDLPPDSKLPVDEAGPGPPVDEAGATMSLDPITQSLHRASILGSSSSLLRSSLPSHPAADGRRIKSLREDGGSDELAVDLPRVAPAPLSDEELRSHSEAIDRVKMRVNRARAEGRMRKEAMERYKAVSSTSQSCLQLGIASQTDALSGCLTDYDVPAEYWMLSAHEASAAKAAVDAARRWLGKAEADDSALTLTESSEATATDEGDDSTEGRARPVKGTSKLDALQQAISQVRLGRRPTPSAAQSESPQRQRGRASVAALARARAVRLE